MSIFLTWKIFQVRKLLQAQNANLKCGHDEREKPISLAESNQY